MNFEEILKNIDEFYKTTDEKTLAKVDAAFSVDLKDDISFDDYLSGFSGEYFYTDEEESSCYESEVVLIETSDREYDPYGFAPSASPYSMQDPISSQKMGTEPIGASENLIKKAA